MDGEQLCEKLSPHSRFLLVEEHGGPAGHEAGLPGEPQKNQQGEDSQHARLSEAHPAQLPVLLSDDLKRLLVTFLIFPASKGLLETGRAQ